MAWLEQRNKNYQLVLRYDGKKCKRSLKTSSIEVAEEILERVERRIRLIEMGDISIPDDADVISYLISGESHERRKIHKPRQTEYTLKKLCEEYLESLPPGALEGTTLETAKVHMKHLKSVLGETFAVRNLNLKILQNYVNDRSEEVGIRGKKLSPVTIRKELGTFSSIWNWAVQSEKLEGVFPNRGLKFPKTDQKQPFQTFEEIERQIERGHLSEAQQADLWDCLYLTQESIERVLNFIKENATTEILYPMVLIAAHTGARRSEICRIESRDFDFESGTLLIRERKRSRTQRTTRKVPLSARLHSVMESWIQGHARQFAFSTEPTELAPRFATEALSNCLDDSKWSVIKGWHVFRHSFISNCAAKGIDQRIIDSWSGHQTEEMRKRYTHLFPDSQRAAMNTVFG